jgi:hypothetical protein
VVIPLILLWLGNFGECFSPKPGGCVQIRTMSMIKSILATANAFSFVIVSFEQWYRWITKRYSLPTELNEASGYLSLATNATATGLIFLKFWYTMFAISKTILFV